MKVLETKTEYKKVIKHYTIETDKGIKLHLTKSWEVDDLLDNYDSDWNWDSEADTQVYMAQDDYEQDKIQDFIAQL
jgi:hypothetical protein